MILIFVLLIVAIVLAMVVNVYNFIVLMMSPLNSVSMGILACAQLISSVCCALILMDLLDFIIDEYKD